ncbi:MAG: GNAT family N-acetyltransferase [Alphaproteobacteria bacterium]|nr:GNAT family N-acetyltransferase [Alphaproteobacteria bacterium]
MAAELRTDRLTLRPLALADAPRLSAITSDPAVARMVARVPCPNPLVAVEGFILIMQARAPLGTDHIFALELPGEGAIGCIGAHGASPDGPFELGYYVGRDWWGHGYATEAAAAVTRYMEANGATHLEAGHFLDNPASGRVLEKAGFVATGEIVPRYSLGRGATVPLRRMTRTLQ